MSNLPESRNPLKAMETRLTAAKTIKEVLQIPSLVDRYVKSYEASTGRTDGMEKFERESFAFMDIVSKSSELQACDRLSQFAGFLKGAQTGLGFGSGKLSVYSRGKMMVVEPDAHGKKEILERLPDIKKIDEGVIVYNEDTFEYDPHNKLVEVHKQKFPTPKPSKETVMACYVSVHFKDGSREDIVMSVDAIERARVHSKQQEGMMWKGHYDEACKKTVYNRVYKLKRKEADTPTIFKRFELKDEGDTIDTTAEMQPAGEAERQTQEQLPEVTGEVKSTKTKKANAPLTDEDFT